MKWFVYPGVGLDRTLTVRDRSGAPYLEIIPASASFLGPMIGRLETTTSPFEAEFFLIPALINFLRASAPDDLGPLRVFLDSFPWFSKLSERHAVFLLGDHSLVPEPCRDSAVFMPSCSRWDRAIPTFYFAEDPGPSVPPIGRAEFVASFQGTTRTGGGVRDRVVDALRKSRIGPVSYRVTDGYFHGIDGPSARAVLRAEFLDGIARSRFVFCPRGDGLSSLRFFETLAHGRLPILVADETALPLEDVLPYEQFMIRIPEGRVEDWESYLASFLASEPDLDRCSSMARTAYLLWFTERTLGAFVERSLEAHRR